MIKLKRVRDGFDQWHFNMDKEEPWPVYPVLHHIWTPDEPRMHDHPHDITCWVQKGWYREETPLGDVVRGVGDCFKLPATYVHRIADVEDYWAVCFYGPTIRDWKFY